MKTGTSCTRCTNAKTCPAYDPQMAYGFCQGFEPAVVQSGPMNENAQNTTENAKTNKRDLVYASGAESAKAGA